MHVPPDQKKTHWRDYVSRLAREHRGIPLNELEEVTGARSMFAVAPAMQLHIKWQKMDERIDLS